MKALRKIAVLGATASLLATGVLVAGTASAEPVSPSYVAVGSDTLQDSMNALANGTSVTGTTVRVATGGLNWANYDAFPNTGTGSTIQTKPNGANFVRPAGSTNGVTALRASITGNPWQGKTITGQIDIARSSDGPGANASDTGLLVYTPYGRDAVSYAYRAADTAAAAVLDSLTTAQLTAIYSAATPTTIDGVTIQPRLPQSGSGTRKFFLGKIGVSNTAPGGAVPASDNTATGPAENDATVLGVNEIIPFSVASWVAQYNGAAPSTIGSTGVQIGSPTGDAPFTVNAGKLVPNGTFYASAFGRDVYLVTEYARVNPSSASYDAKLAGLVTSLCSYGTTPNQPGAVKTRFGFLAPSSATPIRAFATL